MKSKSKKKRKSTSTSRQQGKGLISLADRPKAERIKIARMGGSIRTPGKKYAAKLRELKKKLNKQKKGAGDELEKKMLALMEDPEYSIFDLRMYAEQIKANVGNVKDRIALMRGIIEIHKAHHGTKIRQENLNLNMTIDLTQPFTKDEQMEFNDYITEKRRIRQR